MIPIPFDKQNKRIVTSLVFIDYLLDRDKVRQRERGKVTSYWYINADKCHVFHFGAYSHCVIYRRIIIVDLLREYRKKRQHKAMLLRR